MSRLDYECKNGHRFEAFNGKDIERCPTCRCRAEIIWLAPESPHRQLQDPIVMWRYADGHLGVAGGANSRTPKNAERVEIRTAGEYRRYTKELNQQLREKDEKKDERYYEVKEKKDRYHRSNLSHLMGQETDPYARDLYRVALERDLGGREPLPFSEFYSIVMENDRSNYE